MALRNVSITSLDSFRLGFPSSARPLSNQTLSGRQPLAYYDRLDRVVCGSWLNDTNSGLPRVGWFDPQFVDSSAPASTTLPDNGNSWELFSVGEWDRVLGTQRLYGKDSISNTPTRLVDPTTFSILDADPYPLVRWHGNVGFSSTDEGFFSKTEAQGRFIFFETLGYALVSGATVRQGGVSFVDVMAQVDLATGFATVVPIVVRHQTTPVNGFQGPAVLGDSFLLGATQFVPDDDSAPATPKGFIFLWSTDYFDGGGIRRNYAKVVEWNPTGKTPSPGTPNRVHLRETLLTRFEIPLAGFPSGFGSVVATRPRWAFYHPPSRGIFRFHTSNVGTYTLNESYLRQRVALQADVSAISPPSAQRDVLTGRTILFLSEVVGSIGERVAGVEVEFTLSGASTRDEVVAVTGGIGSTSQLDHFPVDLDPEGPLEVVRNGVDLLVAGVNYTLDAALGELEWLTDEQGNDITASYRHRLDPTGDPEGLLLSTSGRSDARGVVAARVRYGDDAASVGELDTLAADTL